MMFKSQMNGPVVRTDAHRVGIVGIVAFKMIILKPDDRPVSRRQLTSGDTNLPLGIIEDATWDQGEVQLGRGDALVLYTDGATDAQTAGGDLFGQERLLEAIQASRRLPAPSGVSAQEMERAIVSAIHDFVGNAPRFDDLTLMVVART